MARDWRTIALAVLTAAAVALVCAPSSRLEAQQVAARGKAKTPPSAANKSDDEDGNGTAQAKRKRQDPAEAQRAVEAASKLLQAGKAAQAAQSLTATLAGGNLPPAIMARALYLRGMANRQQGKPAQAISDLTSALWLKGGLGADDRADALKQRSGAYADAGLTESGTTAAASPKTGEAREPRERSSGKAWGAVTTPNEPPAASQAPLAGGNWFKNWFGAWSPGASAKSANTTPSATTTASIDKAPSHSQGPRPAPPARVATAWSSSTEVHAAAPAPRHAAKAEGKYRVQLATVRTHREAETLAAKAKRALGALAASDPEIDRTVLGNMGSFYRVRVGPYTSLQETQEVCAKVKNAGFDCMTVTQ